MITGEHDKYTGTFIPYGELGQAAAGGWYDAGTSAFHQGMPNIPSAWMIPDAQRWWRLGWEHAQRSTAPEPVA